ncbi:MAG TPA: NAD/NADP octopine/nopaline dehydrogenase family protein [Bacillota bacterium]|jgi:opine dehydrogenase|nr:NAD/NADP octopine/nopaline dehydrogenase family protein [Bacillota bacterium]
MSNISSLKEKPIAVLGAGAVGKSIAADCALAGARVRICDLPPYSEKTLFGIEKSGIKLYGEQLNLYGFERSGAAKMEIVTEKVEEAVKGAGIIIVALPCIGHRVFFERLIPVLEDGMVIHIFPDNYGSLVLRKMMREANCTKKVIIGGWSSSPFGTRVDIKGGVIMPAVKVDYRAITLRGASLPSIDQEEFFESAKYIGALDSVTKGDGIESGDTVMDIGFSNINSILHAPGTILGVGVMENMGVIFGVKEDFSIYSHAYCPSISRVQYAFYLEEVELAKALGVGIQHYEKKQFFSRESILGCEYMGMDFEIPFEDINHVAWGTGPFSIDTRYLTEDIPVGCHIYHLLGKKCGIKTPVIDSMINIASVMLERDLYAEGYTLDDIGIGHMSLEELHEYLDKGICKE